MNIIKSIAACMMICLASTLCGCSKSKETSQNGKQAIEETSISTTSSTETADISDSNEKTAQATDSEKKKDETQSEKEENDKTQNEEPANSEDNKITINYNLSDDAFQEKQYSSNSEVDLNRPSVLKGSEVFVGWKEQEMISNLENDTYQEGETVSITPETVDICNTRNAIYNDTLFSSSDEEFVEVPIIIGGDTNFSILDLEVAFDTELFSFDSVTYFDEDAVCNYTDDGKLLISFVSTSNVTADVNICNIKLKKNKLEKAETKLHYTIKDITAWNDDCTDYVTTTYEVVNDLIVLY